METNRPIAEARRTYNQWVANQTLEDYALRFTAKGARRWSAFRVANTAIGGISFLALEAIGGAVTLTYGFSNAVAAILVVSSLIFLLGWPISIYAARYGVDIDLLTRGAGFGYLGSTITSLIYATFTFIFFALEAAIMAKALNLAFGVPEALGFVLSSIVVIPLVTHGFTGISRFQMITQPFWVVLHVIPFAVLFLFDDGTLRAWTGFTGRLGHVDGAFDLALFGAASGVVFALVAQIGEQVDYLRFLPESRPGQERKWWIALISAGPGWIVLGALKLLAGSFLAFLAFREGVPPADAAEPTHMYMVAFSKVTQHPGFGLALAAVFVILSQLKINVTNAYAGSIAWSNFFSRLTHSHPGRVVWVVFNVMIALLLMELGIYRSLEKILGLYAHVAVAWVGAIVADLVISKPLGLSPPGIEFKRAHLYDINPAGLGAMAGGSALAIAAHLGLFGSLAAALSSYIALLAALVLAPLIAFLTRSRFYIARAADPGLKLATRCTCSVCVNEFEAEDVAMCPAYGGPICSLCCTLDARCHDQCKKKSRVDEQIPFLGGQGAGPRWLAALSPSLSRYLALLLIVTSVMGSVMALVYWQSLDDPGVNASALALALLKSFLGLFLITCIVSWLFVLAHESREMAQAETERQTKLLMAEIAAHEETDRALQAAKEVAEAANLAKSRYLVGISHEFRTPLNAILGYAQLIEAGDMPEKRRAAGVRTIRRSGEHLAGLVDGLLDIARIEAGRFQLSRDRVAFPQFIEEIADMFRLQAESKGIGFRFEAPEHLPAFVRADEKRLRQVLINLLSNAVKYTEKGEVRLTITLRNEVAQFAVEDTGIGIASTDMERIFVPFERIENPEMPWVPGTGLGLTLTKLMTEMMGGAIAVQSTPGVGSRFSIRMHLPALTPETVALKPEGRITGYLGPRLKVLVVDDEPSHRALAGDILRPLGFGVVDAGDGTGGLAAFARIKPDIVLLDVTMPGMSGWEVARTLREEQGFSGAIVMMSAIAGAEKALPPAQADHDGFVGKPIRIERLLSVLGEASGLTWLRGEEAAPSSPPLRLPAGRILELRALAEVGLLQPLLRRLEALKSEFPAQAPALDALAARVGMLDFEPVLHLNEDDPHERSPA